MPPDVTVHALVVLLVKVTASPDDAVADIATSDEPIMRSLGCEKAIDWFSKPAGALAATTSRVWNASGLAALNRLLAALDACSWQVPAARKLTVAGDAEPEIEHTVPEPDAMLIVGASPDVVAAVAE